MSARARLLPILAVAAAWEARPGAAQDAPRITIEKLRIIDSALTDPMDIPSAFEGPVYLNGAEEPIILPPLQDRLRRYLGEEAYADYQARIAEGEELSIAWITPQFHRECDSYRFEASGRAYGAESCADEPERATLGPAHTKGGLRRLTPDDLEHPLFQAAAAYLREQEGKTQLEWWSGRAYLPVP